MEQKCMFCNEFSRCSTVPDVESSQPDVCPSLVHHCLHVISKDASLHVSSQLRTLPVPILENLKFYLASDSLINLTSFFEECGIDTRLAWDHLVHKRFGSKDLSRCEAWISPRLSRFPFQLAVDCRHPRQVFLAKVCQKLTQHAMEAAEESFKQKGVAALTGHGKETICRPCVTRFTSYLDFVTSFVISWKQLSLISFLVSRKSEKYMTSALKSMLGQLVNLEINHITFNNLDLVCDCLKQLITGGTLKSLALYDLQEEDQDDNMLMLLENLFLTEETKELSTHSPSDTKAGHGSDIEDVDAKDLSTHSSGDTIERQALVDTEWKSPYLLGETVEGHGLDIEEAHDTEVGGETFDLFDKALNSNTDQSHVQYWMNDTDAMVNIRKKMKLWEGEGLGNSNIRLESLQFALEGTESRKIRYGRLAKVFQALKHVRRLCIDDKGNHGENYDCEEVLIMLGCKRLTHLRLNYTQNEQAILLLFSILFENYRLGCGPSTPLDYLCLKDIVCSGEGLSVCHYDFEIAAVRKLELNSCQLSCCATDALVHFLSHNTSLCHLELTDVLVDKRSSGEEWPPLTSLLKGISSISSLETLILRNTNNILTWSCSMFSMDLRLRMSEQRSALQSLIERRPNLKHLVLNDFSFSHQFGMDSDFLGALKQNSNLEHLSLSNTPIGTSAIDLLLAISEPGSFRALKGLNLERCEIAGKQLIEAGKQISKWKKGALYLRYLNLDHNHISFAECTEIQRLFSPCVTLLDIKSS